VDDPAVTVAMNSKLYGLVPQFKKTFLKPQGLDKYLFMPDKLRAWMQSTFTKAFPTIQEYFPRFGILDASFIS
jgi:hypothetical protein